MWELASPFELLAQVRINHEDGRVDYDLLAEIVRRGLAEDPARRDLIMANPPYIVLTGHPLADGHIVSTELAFSPARKLLPVVIGDRRLPALPTGRYRRVEELNIVAEVYTVWPV